IQIAHAPPERLQLAVAQSSQKFVCELLAAQIHPTLRRMMRYETLAQSLKQVRLAQAASPMNEQRVVLRSGELRHAYRRVKRKLIAGAHYKIAQSVAQARRA